MGNGPIDLSMGAIVLECVGVILLLIAIFTAVYFCTRPTASDYARLKSRVEHIHTVEARRLTARLDAQDGEIDQLRGEVRLGNTEAFKARREARQQQLGQTNTAVEETRKRLEAQFKTSIDGERQRNDGLNKTVKKLQQQVAAIQKERNEEKHRTPALPQEVQTLLDDVAILNNESERRKDALPPDELEVLQEKMDSLIKWRDQQQAPVLSTEFATLQAQVDILMKNHRQEIAEPKQEPQHTSDFSAEILALQNQMKDLYKQGKQDHPRNPGGSVDVAALQNQVDSLHEGHKDLWKHMKVSFSSQSSDMQIPKGKQTEDWDRVIKELKENRQGITRIDNKICSYEDEFLDMAKKWKEAKAANIEQNLNNKVPESAEEREEQPQMLANVTSTVHTLQAKQSDMEKLLQEQTRKTIDAKAETTALKHRMEQSQNRRECHCTASHTKTQNPGTPPDEKDQQNFGRASDYDNLRDDLKKLESQLHQQSTRIDEIETAMNSIQKALIPFEGKEEELSVRMLRKEVEDIKSNLGMMFGTAQNHFIALEDNLRITQINGENGIQKLQGSTDQTIYDNNMTLESIQVQFDEVREELDEQINDRRTELEEKIKQTMSEMKEPSEGSQISSETAATLEKRIKQAISEMKEPSGGNQMSREAAVTLNNKIDRLSETMQSSFNHVRKQFAELPKGSDEQRNDRQKDLEERISRVMSKMKESFRGDQMGSKAAAALEEKIDQLNRTTQAAFEGAQKQFAELPEQLADLPKESDEQLLEDLNFKVGLWVTPVSNKVDQLEQLVQGLENNKATGVQTGDDDLAHPVAESRKNSEDQQGEISKQLSEMREQVLEEARKNIEEVRQKEREFVGEAVRKVWGHNLKHNIEPQVKQVGDEVQALKQKFENLNDGLSATDFKNAINRATNIVFNEEQYREKLRDDLAQHRMALYNTAAEDSQSAENPETDNDEKAQQWFSSVEGILCNHFHEVLIHELNIFKKACEELALNELHARYESVKAHTEPENEPNEKSDGEAAGAEDSQPPHGGDSSWRESDDEDGSQPPPEGGDESKAETG